MCRWKMARLACFAAGILFPALVKGDLVRWSAEQPLLDADNPDPELRDRPLLGMELTDKYRKRGSNGVVSYTILAPGLGINLI